MKENKNLFCIHGAWCTKNSFNYIIKKVLDDSHVGNIKCFEYDCQTEPLFLSVRRAKEEMYNLSKNGLKTVIVGHSLGGLIALKLSQNKHVHKTITLASPLGGIESINWFVHYYMSYTTPIFSQLVPSSKFIKNLHSKDYTKNPIECLIATSGYNPMISEPSDGVISVKCQLSWTPESAKISMIKANHSEILLCPETILTIERTLNENIIC